MVTPLRRFRHILPFFTNFVLAPIYKGGLFLHRVIRADFRLAATQEGGGFSAPAP